MGVCDSEVMVAGACVVSNGALAAGATPTTDGFVFAVVGAVGASLDIAVFIVQAGI